MAPLHLESPALRKTAAFPSDNAAPLKVTAVGYSAKMVVGVREMLGGDGGEVGGGRGGSGGGKDGGIEGGGGDGGGGDGDGGGGEGIGGVGVPAG